MSTLQKKIKSLKEINNAVAYQQLVRNIFITYETIFNNLEYKSKNRPHLREKNLILKFRLISKTDFLNFMNKYKKKIFLNSISK